MIIADIRKNSAETLRIQISDFKGSRYVDIRVYAQGVNGLIPTKKGATLSPAILKEVILALEKAKEGLLMTTHHDYGAAFMEG